MSPKVSSVLEGKLPIYQYDNAIKQNGSNGNQIQVLFLNGLYTSFRRVYQIATDHGISGRIHSDISLNIPPKKKRTHNFVNL